MKNSPEINTLLERIRYFFSSYRRGRTSVISFLEDSCRYGDPIIFGGMLRDLALCDNRKFSSDIDVVLNGCNDDKLESLVAKYSGKRNKFGGFRLHFEKWDVDVWSFDNTWAIKKGYVSPTHEKDILKTSFFNWDAIAYSKSSNSLLMSDHYFEHLRTRFLDINLEPNPNPVGIYKRTIRFLFRDQAALSPRLAKYYCQNISYLDALKNSNLHQDRVFYVDAWHLKKHIAAHLEVRPNEPFKLQGDLLSNLDFGNY